MNELPVLAVSFSFGRTSGYMCKWLIDNMSHKYRLVFVFMNTGLEDERTLEFGHKCDIEFNLNLIWLEADINQEKGKGTRHKVVSYETASRNGEPFYDMVRAYGVPNKSYPHCNRELKLQVFNSWLAENHPKAKRAVGIRVDEIDRMAANMDELGIIYPLITMKPTNKGDVLGWWSRQSFDLMLPEHRGNCVTCWKKSDRKLFTLINETPWEFDHFEKMEIIAKDTGSNADNNKGNFFRNNRNTADMRKEALLEFDKFEDKYFNHISNENNGCSGSCDPFE